MSGSWNSSLENVVHVCAFACVWGAHVHHCVCVQASLCVCKCVHTCVYTLPYKDSELF